MYRVNCVEAELDAAGSYLNMNYPSVTNSLTAALYPSAGFVSAFFSFFPLILSSSLLLPPIHLPLVCTPLYYFFTFGSPTFSGTNRLTPSSELAPPPFHDVLFLSHLYPPHLPTCPRAAQSRTSPLSICPFVFFLSLCLALFFSLSLCFTVPFSLSFPVSCGCRG